LNGIGGVLVSMPVSGTYSRLFQPVAWKHLRTSRRIELIAPRRMSGLSTRAK